jgi:hypothetical protein
MLKAGSIGPPTQHLVASVGKCKFENGDECWYMASHQYVAEAIRNVSNWLEGRGQALKTKVASVRPSNYQPEMDVSQGIPEQVPSCFSTVPVLCGSLRSRIPLRPHPLDPSLQL